MNSVSLLLFFLLVSASLFLALQAFIGAGRQVTQKIKAINNHVSQMHKLGSTDAVLKSIRRARGLKPNGYHQRLLTWFHDLVVHSGLRFGLSKIYAGITLSALILMACAFVWKSSVLWGAIGFGCGLALPVLILKFLAKRRCEKAVAQLPEALDVIIRSLEAGHPVPVALALVGREMPDPLGSEFAIASDEISYGSDLSDVIERLSQRVGHDDFLLFSAMIRLQKKTGGNLVDLLRSNASTLRERQRMRLKIRAASAEGRTSAKILNVAPIALYFFVRISNPDFYGDVEGHKAVEYGFYAVIIWMAVGNLIMRKMINFRI